MSPLLCDPCQGSWGWENLSEGLEVAQVRAPTKQEIAPEALLEQGGIQAHVSHRGDSLSHLTVTAEAFSAT